MDVINIAPARYVLIKLAATVIGTTPKAIEHKIQNGLWVEGREWRRGPDNRIYVDLKGVEQWVEKVPASRSGKPAFA